MVYIEFNNGCGHLKLNHLSLTLLKHKLDRLVNFTLQHANFKMTGKICVRQVTKEKGALESIKL